MTCISFHPPPATPPEPWQPDPEPGRREPSSPALATILLVEDDETVREVVARGLQYAGYHVVTAADGVEALAAIGQMPALDLLITDIRMPRMGGHALSQRILERRPDLPIVYISGYVADWHPDAAAAGVRAFLRKPFAEEDLLRACRTLLGRAEG
jgi:two-component system cell cycle sensor histidine kinase/response regulator CckA